MTSTANQNNSTNSLRKLILREGITGKAVQKLQRLLKNYRTYSAAVDGIFGPETTGGVILFQHRFFLPEDGIVGYKTWQALYKGRPVDMPVLRRGNQGKLVETLQHRLYIVGEYTGMFDGNFGVVTQAGVKSFQHHNKLTADGIVDDRTWFALSNTPELVC